VSATPDISVVVATHDRRERLAALLAGLRAQSLGPERFEVVVVDDASSDGSAELLEAERQRGELALRWVREETGRGPASARNRGWRMAQAPLVAFTDDDCVPVPGWLEALLALAATDEHAIVQGRTLPNPDERDALGPFAKTVHIPQASPHYETCNIAYPRALLERVGGFDEAYPAPAGEDSDLGWRALEAGGVALFAPEAVVHHAVFPQSPVRALRGALMATHGVQAYKRNPGLREHLTQGVFYERSHPLLLQAALGAWLARREPAAAAFCLPYLLHLRSRCRQRGASPAAAPYFALYDAVQVAATVRGAIRHRFPVI
jgi:GT2 family glycosyltransferase